MWVLQLLSCLLASDAGFGETEGDVDQLIDHSQTFEYSTGAEMPPPRQAHWSMMSFEEEIAGETLFEVDDCKAGSAQWPCCAGMLHNGGGHDFNNKEVCRGQIKHLRFRPEDGRTFEVQQGRALLRALKGRTLFMLGDSVVHQRFLGFECAARRSGCTTTSRLVDNLKTAGLSSCSFWRNGISHQETVSMTCPKAGSEAAFEATLVYFQQYQPCLNNRTGAWAAQEQAAVRDAVWPDGGKTGPGLVALLPIIGAHYEWCAAGDRSADAAQHALRAVLASPLAQEWLASERTVVVYPETSTSHMALLNGEFCDKHRVGHFLHRGDYNVTLEDWRRNNGLRGCWEPKWGSVAQRAWKDKLMLRELLRLQIPVRHVNSSSSVLGSSFSPLAVVWVPFFESSAMRPDWHPVGPYPEAWVDDMDEDVDRGRSALASVLSSFLGSGLVLGSARPASYSKMSGCTDPTHFCYSPLIFENQVDLLTRALA